MKVKKADAGGAANALTRDLVPDRFRALAHARARVLVLMIQMKMWTHTDVLVGAVEVLGMPAESEKRSPCFWRTLDFFALICHDNPASCTLGLRKISRV